VQRPAAAEPDAPPTARRRAEPGRATRGGVREERAAREGAYVSAGVAWDLHTAAAEDDVPLSPDGGEASDTPGGAGGGLRLRFTGRVGELGDGDRRALCDRATSSDPRVRARTAAIIERVRAEGDAALVALARELDHAELERVEVPRAEWRAALEHLDGGLRRAMERTIRNVRAVHEAFRPKATQVEPEPGIVVGRRPDPLGRVGVYAPGGRAAYPSSVFMGVVPARVAGVGEVVLCSPPGDDGLPSPVVLAAAALADVDRVFALGGAGAIAAMAYGTASVPRCDRIVGPGNAYVAEAKLQVSGACAIDGPAGPSELLVIADHTADPVAVARELLAQAEHDPLAAVVAVAVGDETAEQVALALEELLPRAERAEIVREALARQGAVLVAQTYDEATAFANEYAAEHLQLAIGEPEMRLVLSRLRNVGTVFLGETSSVAYGDYMTGANHVLPTGGLARSYSGLSTLDFVRWTTWQRVTPQAAAKLAYDVGRFADAEGLPGHAAAARAWMKDAKGGRTRLGERALRSAAKRIREESSDERSEGREARGASDPRGAGAGGGAARGAPAKAVGKTAAGKAAAAKKGATKRGRGA
jgi:histidinol dehydrogenase